MNNDNESTTPVSGEPAANGEAPSAANRSRRHFARSAVAGGAVLLTLGNRGAWGVSGTAKPGNQLCISQNTWESFVSADFQISAAATDTRYDEVRQFADYVESTGETPHLVPGHGEYCVKIKK